MRLERSAREVEPTTPPAGFRIEDVRLMPLGGGMAPPVCPGLGIMRDCRACGAAIVRVFEVVSTGDLSDVSPPIRASSAACRCAATALASSSSSASLLRPLSATLPSLPLCVAASVFSALLLSEAPSSFRPSKPNTVFGLARAPKELGCGSRLRLFESLLFAPLTPPASSSGLIGLIGCGRRVGDRMSVDDMLREAACLDAINC